MISTIQIIKLEQSIKHLSMVFNYPIILHTTWRNAYVHFNDRQKLEDGQIKTLRQKTFNAK